MFRLSVSSVQRFIGVSLNCDGICFVGRYLKGSRCGVCVDGKEFCRFYCSSNDSKEKKTVTLGKKKEIESNEISNKVISKKKVKDPDSGSLKSWIQRNIKKNEPKNMPTDSSKLDHLDRLAVTSGIDDYDYKTVHMVASYYDGASKDWEGFKTVVEAFKKPDKSGMRVGQVEFIYGSLKRLKDFGLHKDTRAYNALLNVFPKEKMIPENIVQAGFLHYAKQQLCAIDLLEEMETCLVLPDQETVDSVDAIFGRRSYVFSKMGSMIYWTTKARYNDPYPMPNVLPLDPKELAKISFRRMSKDHNTAISVYSTEAVPGALDKTWICSAISPVQETLIGRLSEPLYIDGPHLMWLKDHSINYFVLKTAAPRKVQEEEKEYEDMRDLPLYAYGGLSKAEHIEKIESVHKTDEGTICGLVATGTSSRDSLLSYIRILQYHIPKLKELSIIFTQRAPETAIGPFNENEQDGDSPSGGEKDEEIKLIVNK